ncbi:hypothetical protein [Oceanicoccus sagamiensis]|uniref:hypothetical protein n=1 Tax=Oceanicoccus sagamiensis TaxID=716816 RepID=UPI0012F4FBA8|nr:hypothetical protein [Oceanicoccus sagamiensis]
MFNFLSDDNQSANSHHRLIKAPDSEGNIPEPTSPIQTGEPVQPVEKTGAALPQATSGLEYYQNNADPTLPLSTVVGQWQSQIGVSENAPPQPLLLKQQQQLLTGDIAGYPIVAWVKGNVFQMTVRRQGGQGQIRYRYRGVIAPDSEQIKGTVAIQLTGFPEATLDWVANRE